MRQNLCFPPQIPSHQCHHLFVFPFLGHRVNRCSNTPKFISLAMAWMLNSKVGLNTWIIFVQCRFPIIKVDMSWASNILRSESVSIGFSSHNIGTCNTWGSTLHTFLCSSSRDKLLARNCHHEFGIFPHVGSMSGRKPNLALFAVNGKMFLHAIASFLLNHPIT